MQSEINWTDTEEIGIQLQEAHPAELLAQLKP